MVLFLDAGLFQYLLYIRDLHVADLACRRTSGPVQSFPGKKTGYAERVFAFDDRDEDIIFVDDIVLEYRMDNVRRYFLGVPGEKQRGALDSTCSYRSAGSSEGKRRPARARRAF